MNVFTELLPTIPVNGVSLCHVRNGDRGTINTLLPLFRGLSEVRLRFDSAEQATNATLRICREIGISGVFVDTLVSDSSAISEEGIFDFCFGAEADASSGSVRELKVLQPRLTPQFLGRLISMTTKASSKTPLVLKIHGVVVENTSFRPVPCDRHPGLCYRFDGDIPFHLRVNSVYGTLELRRGTAVDGHMAEP
ncbi:hypothetical protein AAVH_16170 [Aphelenchoides avenae]|nr:hypothetical protein AAVH_16170 [Aphelenchus avenae]